MDRTIGIDAGGTFIKLAYEEEGRIHTKLFPTKDMEKAAGFLSMLTAGSSNMLTGGKAEALAAHLGGQHHFISEFDATCEGAKHLMMEEYGKTPASFIVVMIGTGTSIHLVSEHGHQRLLGSGIGGGTFTGLGRLLTGETDYDALMELANSGNRRNADLLVGDIYAPAEPPIPGDLTAANFGRVFSNGEISKADAFAAAANMIGETLVLLATQAASQHCAKDIVFIGGALKENKSLRHTLTHFRKLLGYETWFPDKGAYAGAIGALLCEHSCKK